MRKNAAPKRPVVKDPVYNSEQVTMLVNKILQDGKKSTAERIVYGALCGGLLAIEEDLVHEHGDLLGVVYRVLDYRTLRSSILTHC